jgi:Transcription initiation factor IID, 31kD subunit
LSLAAQTNAVPLPAVPEVFGVRLPPASECLTAVDFDLIPNKPPTEVKQYDEEVEEVEESESDEDEEMEQADIPSVPSSGWNAPGTQQPQQSLAAQVQMQVNPMLHPMAVQTPSDVDMLGVVGGGDDASEDEEEDGLFAGGEEEEESGDEAMEEVTASQPTENGGKRKLMEEEDYD